MFGRILVAFGMAVVVVCLALCVAIVVPPMFGSSPYNVVTASMTPAITPGSLVYSQSVDPATLQVGDIVTFHEPLESAVSSTGQGTNAQNAGRIITHRVTQNDTDLRELRTKGDANPDEDLAPVGYSNVIGKVTIVVPFIGSVATALSSWMGKIFMVCLIIGGMLLALAGDTIIRRANKPSN